ncbi:MAG TPA: OmpA family protein [Caulobacteraceae bacterium]|nr:OmpA family protein [Caulobacteraceae bacterium]
MRALILSTAISAIAGIAAAAPAPQYSVGDVVNSFAQSSDKAPSACPPGQSSDEDGICQPNKDTRGFSLPTRAAPGGPRPAGSGPAMHAAGPARAPASAPHRDLLITFKLGSAELTDQAQANAKVFAKALSTQQLGDARFEIEGHTDATGSDDLNQKLSQARADAVAAFLAAQGVDASRLQARGYGSSRLAVPEDPTSPANRRVEARRLN